MAQKERLEGVIPLRLPLLLERLRSAEVKRKKKKKNDKGTADK